MQGRFKNESERAAKMNDTIQDAIEPIRLDLTQAKSTNDLRAPPIDLFKKAPFDQIDSDSFPLDDKLRKAVIQEVSL